MVGPTGFVFVVGMGTSALFFATAVLIVLSAFRKKEIKGKIAGKAKIRRRR